MVAPTLLADRYRVEDQVGLGGMGTVYAADDERLHRRVAVKLLKQELSSDPRFIERFRREARSAAALSHPNVANVFDYGEEQGSYFIVMELVEGRDLSRVMREEGPLDPVRALRIAEQIGRALGHAHAAGLIHRDVKPHNIIVCDDGRVKVTDFGIARATGESTLTATGTILGTAQYVSPEQASGEDPGPPSDVYSLGVVLYEMVTGAVPFTGDSPVSVALRHVRDEVPPPSSIDPKIPSDVDALVTRATAKQPDARFRDGNAFADAIVGRSTDTPADTVPATAASTWPFTHPPRWDPNRLGRTVLVVFAVLFAVALGALAWRLASNASDRDEGNDRGRAAGVQSPTTSTIAVDDYTGMQAQEATTAIEGAGLEVVPRYEECEQPRDHVCTQSPDAGSTVGEGDPVTLVISTPEEDDEESDDDEDSGEAGKSGKVPPGKAKKEKDKD